MVKHFEVALYASFWGGASALAWLAGRPWLGLVGVVTVLPFLLAHLSTGSSRSRRS